MSYPGLAVRSKADETFVIVETLICPLQISHLTWEMLVAWVSFVLSLRNRMISEMIFAVFVSLFARKINLMIMNDATKS